MATAVETQTKTTPTTKLNAEAGTETKTETKTNTAAWWSKATKTLKLDIGPAPYRAPKANEIVVENHALAINPMDWSLLRYGTLFMFTWLKLPFVLGADLSGTVVDVGPNVTRFKPGDRVMGHAVGSDEKINDAAQGAFQKFTVLQAHMAAKIPDSMSFEDACVLPLGLSTAACGLFQEDQLNLRLPTLNAPPTNETLLVWGGSTSVGSNAIQLAVAAGYEVFTTCSPKNFAFVTKLGAAKAFDYNSATVVPDILAAYHGKTSAGIISVGASCAEPSVHILAKLKGKKFISRVTYPIPSPAPKSFVLPRMMASMMPWHVANFCKTKLAGVKWEFVFGSTLAFNGLGGKVYEFVESALAEGTYVASPQPLVVGSGLEALEEAIAKQEKGVSAAKVVVTL